MSTSTCKEISETESNLELDPNTLELQDKIVFLINGKMIIMQFFKLKCKETTKIHSLITHMKIYSR